MGFDDRFYHVPMTKEECSIVWDVLFDHYRAKEEELSKLTQEIEKEGNYWRSELMKWEKYKLEEYIETVRKIRSRIGHFM